MRPFLPVVYVILTTFLNGLRRDVAVVFLASASPLVRPSASHEGGSIQAIFIFFYFFFDSIA